MRRFKNCTRGFLSTTLLMFFWLIGAANVAEARTLQAEKLGFRFVLPDSAQEFPEGKTRPTILHSYILESPETGRLVVGIESLEGTLDRPTHLKLEKLPPGSKLFSTHWRDFTVEGADMIFNIEGVKMVTRAVQVPLKPEAVQLYVMGNEDQVEQIATVLKAVLDSVEGQSNWLTDEERSEKLGYGVGMAVGVAIAIPLALRLRSRRSV